jgi:hypothetical protein
MGSRNGRRRQHKRHKQRARMRRASWALQSTLRRVYASEALSALRSQGLLMRALRFSGVRYAEAAPWSTEVRWPTALGQLAAKLQRPTFFAFGDSNLGAR